MSTGDKNPQHNYRYLCCSSNTIEDKLAVTMTNILAACVVQMQEPGISCSNCKASCFIFFFIQILQQPFHNLFQQQCQEAVLYFLPKKIPWLHHGTGRSKLSQLLNDATICECCSNVRYTEFHHNCDCSTCTTTNYVCSALPQEHINLNYSG